MYAARASTTSRKIVVAAPPAVVANAANSRTAPYLDRFLQDVGEQRCEWHRLISPVD